MKNPYQNAVPFPYVLLETYKKIGLSEDEAFVALLIDHLLELGNHFISADMLSLKMSKGPKEINAIMNSLLEKGLLNYTMKEKMETSLSPLIDKCYALFASSIEKQCASMSDKEMTKVRSELIAFFEEKLARSLSPLEKDTISEWASGVYSLEEIKNALLDTLKTGKKTIREVGKTLKAHRKENDLLKEGASAISDSWDKDIEATMELTRSLWKKNR
ncbi:MAG TPA: hypothetical protein DCZ41_04965 [Firmicutes bacterium]|nr:hypothetical protein [Bacillota bacterium]